MYKKIHIYFLLMKIIGMTELLEISFLTHFIRYDFLFGSFVGSYPYFFLLSYSHSAFSICNLSPLLISTRNFLVIKNLWCQMHEELCFRIVVLGSKARPFPALKWGQVGPLRVWSEGEEEYHSASLSSIFRSVLDPAPP